MLRPLIAAGMRLYPFDGRAGPPDRTIRLLDARIAASAFANVLLGLLVEVLRWTLVVTLPACPLAPRPFALLSLPFEAIVATAHRFASLALRA